VQDPVITWLSIRDDYRTLIELGGVSVVENDEENEDD